MSNTALMNAEGRTVQGVYVKPKGGDSLLGQLGYVLDEIPAQLPLEADPTAANGQSNGAPALETLEHANEIKGKTEGFPQGILEWSLRPFLHVLYHTERDFKPLFSKAACGGRLTVSSQPKGRYAASWHVLESNP